MEIYLVGGAVRDKLLGLKVTERDWVVVGASVEQMLELGYKPIGKDFPVFLHPQTREEYALARTERKTAKGYKGFTFHTDPTITLEQDLKRRDLTINAMAETKDGQVIDPFDGAQDLTKKILRHVSEAFAEDPVRILRLARFAARYSDFTIHPTTMKLMQHIVSAGEVNALVPERVWQEFVRALQETAPWQFFEVLQQCGALNTIYPEFAANFDSTLANLSAAVKISTKPTIRFAVLTSSFTNGKLTNFTKKNKIPHEYKELAQLIIKYKNSYRNANNAEELLTILEQTDFFRRPKRFEDFLISCQIIFPNSNPTLLQNASEAVAKIEIKNIITPDMDGNEIKKIIHERRLDAIRKII